MGGILSRLYVQDAAYPSRGDVRRIVTANSPHAGSQMANLLLDRNADPRGLQCEWITGLLSLSGFPGRGCEAGAVSDLRVTSSAIFALNQSLHPPSVDVHALATVFDVENLPTVVGVGPLSTLLAVNLQRCGTATMAQVFNQDDHDVVVSATSQAGGLSGNQTSLYAGLVHVGSVAASDVIDEVKDLLQEPVLSTRFSSAGYAPAPRLTYPRSRVSRPLGGPRRWRGRATGEPL